LAFINKLDRPGADPARVVGQLRSKLKLNAAPVALPIGLEADHAGVVDLVRRVALTFEGAAGETVVEGPVPSSMVAAVDAARLALVEAVADADDATAEVYLAGGDVSPETLAAGVRRATLALALVPVFMGSAFKNRGVQHLLDGVAAYLPAPGDVANVGLDLDADEAPTPLPSTPSAPLVALAFKLEEGRFGQLTYVRVYSGTLRKGDVIMNAATRKKVKVPRLVRMHAADMVDIQAAAAGDIVALFGVDCASGDTFTDGKGPRVALTSMNVPDPVMSLAVSPTTREGAGNFGKALARFQKEDPTFRVATDGETGQTLISGMGELHLEIYVERMKREYGCTVDVGRPRVNYREAVTARADFDHLHRKQSGGQGQYARVVGYIEPLSADDPGGPGAGGLEFARETVGNAIPASFLPAVDKGFREAAATGALTGHPVDGVRFALTDGAAHAVDSSELAFKIAATAAFRDAYMRAKPVVLEPVMAVEVRAPLEFQGAVVGDLNRRKGVVGAAEADGDDAVLSAAVPLSAMFGYSTTLRSMTQGKGEFSMAYSRHAPLPADAQAELAAAHRGRRSGGDK
jgi:elongation factor G